MFEQKIHRPLQIDDIGSWFAAPEASVSYMYLLSVRSFTTFIIIFSGSGGKKLCLRGLLD